MFPFTFQLTNPYSLQPPMKFGTVPWTHTENMIRKKYPDMYSYMKKFNQSDVSEGISAVKKG